MRWLIGIDDTDNADSPGTGQLARRLSAEIERFGGRLLGTTRHQFLIDPLIPFTGHNRGICIGLDWDATTDDLDFVFDLVGDWSAPGSDPGVCLARADAVLPPVVDWGERAMREVLEMQPAMMLAQEHGLKLRMLGGTGQGIIGALASAGLRAGGEIGRFVDMPGLRSLGESVSREQLAAMGIDVERIAGSDSPPPALPGIIKTLGWIRPRLRGGRPVLHVQWSDHEHAWVPVDRKTVHPPADPSVHSLEQG